MNRNLLVTFLWRVNIALNSLLSCIYLQGILGNVRLLADIPPKFDSASLFFRSCFVKAHGRPNGRVREQMEKKQTTIVNVLST